MDDLIKERIDLKTKSNDEISDESKEKLYFLKSIIAKKDGKYSFFEISKPLRKEIMSMDGATVLDLNGNLFCAGSIISVPGGSSGGGRTAATKKLAEYGVGIKISEDGYIEAYGKDLNDEGETKNITPIFQFK